MGAYPRSAKRILLAAQASPTQSDLAVTVRRMFPEVRSQSTTRGYIGVLVTLGLLERQAGSRLVLTPSGNRYLRTEDLKILRIALYDRVFGARETLEAVAEGPIAFPALREQLADRGVSWSSPMAARYRVWWLTASDALQAERKSRADWLTLTRAGAALLRR